MITDPNEISSLLDQAQDAFEQRNLDRVLNLCDQVLEASPVESPEYEQAEDLRRHAAERDLLSAITAAADPHTAIPLIESALKKGLRYDLNQQSLNELLQGFVNQRSETASQQALKLLEDGKTLEKDGAWNLARDCYQKALQVEYLSEAAKKLCQAALEAVDSLMERQAAYAEKLQHARALQQDARYPEALEAARLAVKIYPEGSDEAENLEAELRRQVDQEQQARQQAAAARAALDAGGLEQAASTLQGARALADLLALKDLQSQVQNLEAELTQARSQRGSETESLKKQFMERATERAWESAEKILEDLRRLAPEDPSIDALQADLRKRQEAVGEVNRLLAEAEKLRSPRDRMEVLEKAAELMPGDPTVQDKFQAARQELILQAMLATRAEIDLGFDTPDELQHGKLGPNKEVLIEGIDQLVQTLGEEASLELIDKYRENFRRIAARKLREFIHLLAYPLLPKGEFDRALEYYDQALRSWGQQWLLISQITLVTDDNKKVIEWYENRALQARRDLVRRERDLIDQARQVAPELLTSRQESETAAANQQLETAWRKNLQALRLIRNQAPGVAWALNGMRADLLQRLLKNLGAWVQEVAQQIHTAAHQAETLRDLGQLDESLQAADQARQASQHLKRQIEELAEVLPEKEKDIWGAAGLEKQALEVYAGVECYRASWLALENARQAIADGDYADARTWLLQVDTSTPWMGEAQARLELVQTLVQMKIAYEQARTSQDYLQALEQLNQIIGSDGGQWARKEREALQPLVEKQRSAQGYIAMSQESLEKRRFDGAAEFAQKALDLFPENSAAQKYLNQANQGLAEQASALQARQEMLAAYHSGKTILDYQTAAEKAAFVLEITPQDTLALRIQGEVQRILELDHSVQELWALGEWGNARDALEKVHLRSDYLSGLKIEINRKLAEQLNYDRLVEQAEAAREKEDWANGLLRASQALVRYPDRSEPANLAEEARFFLVERIKELLSPAGDIQEAGLDEAERSYQALSAPERTLAEAAANPGSESNRPLLDLHHQQAQQALFDVDEVYDRARRLVHTRRYLATGEVERAYAEIKFLGEARLVDEVVQGLYQTASFRFRIKQAEQVLNTRPVDYDQAVTLLRSALQISPEGTLVEQEKARRLLAGAELEAGLKHCAQTLVQGLLPDAARSTLTGLPQDEPRVQEYLALLDLLETSLKEAGRLHASGYHASALDLLDECLKKLPGYQPVENQRLEILKDALERARQSEEKEDYQTARSYYNLVRQRGSEELRPAGQQGFRDLEERLERHFRDLFSDVDRGMQDSDLTEVQRFELEKRLLAASRMDTERQKATLGSRLEEIKLRADPLREVELELNEGQVQLDQALKAETYELASTYFQQAKAKLDKAANIPYCTGRERTRLAFRVFNGHMRLRNDVKDKMQAYTEVKSRLHDPNLAPLNPETLTANLVETRQDDLRRKLSEASELNDWLRKNDPNNQYRLRLWPEKTPDPLIAEAEHYAGQLQAVTEIGPALLAAVNLRQAAVDESLQALNLFQQATKDEDYDTAISLWTKAAEHSQKAQVVLSPLQLPALPLPAVQQLYQPCQAVKARCSEIEEAASQRLNDTKRKVTELRRLRADADDQWNEIVIRDKAAVIALGLYQDILQENPQDSQAQRRERELKQRLSAARQSRQKWMLVGVGGILVALVVLLGALTLRPGAAFNPSTATVTASQTTTPTARPTHTPTATASLTATRRPTITPSPSVTITHAATPTPQACQVRIKTWLLNSPNKTASGFLMVYENQDLTILDASMGQDGLLWYKVQMRSGIENQVGFIPASQCEIRP